MIERYSRPDFVQLWSDASRYETWLTVELAACEAMERDGSVPKGAAAAVRAKAEGKLSPARIRDIAAAGSETGDKLRHDIVAFATHVDELAGEPARWLHLGLTSSDVLDTSLAVLCRDALDRILAGIDALRGACLSRAREHKRTPMVGRCHGMHAEPTTAGLTFARWYAELGRSRERVERARHGIAVGKLAGAVGTYANVSPAVEAEALSALGLIPETVATQVVARDRHADVSCALALLGAVIEQIAGTIRHWQRTEVGEAQEAFGRNPVQSETLTGLARLLRAYADASLENVALWHERDISHASVECVTLPDATTLVDFMLACATELVRDLAVFPARMRANLDRSGGLIFSEAVLQSLVRAGLPRLQADAVVQRCAMAAQDGADSFRTLLGADPDIAPRLTAEHLDSLFDLDHHLRHIDHIFKRATAE